MRLMTFLMVANFLSAGMNAGSALDAAEGKSWWVLVSCLIAVFNFAVGWWTMKTRDKV